MREQHHPSIFNHRNQLAMSASIFNHIETQFANRDFLATANHTFATPVVLEYETVISIADGIAICEDDGDRYESSIREDFEAGEWATLVAAIKSETEEATTTEAAPAPSKLNRAEIFRAAHKTAKATRNQFASYAKALGAALRAEYKAAKSEPEPATPAEDVIVFEVSGKASTPATYKQYNYLAGFENVELDINVSQFTKRFDRYEASEAIDLAKEGNRVRIVY